MLLNQQLPDECRYRLDALRYQQVRGRAEPFRKSVALCLPELFVDVEEQPDAAGDTITR